MKMEIIQIIHQIMTCSYKQVVLKKRYGFPKMNRNCCHVDDINAVGGAWILEKVKKIYCYAASYVFTLKTEWVWKKIASSIMRT